MLTWLTDTEVDALLATPDRATWTGQRDHALLVLAVQTGLRISELVALTHADLHLGAGAHVHCMGKGRKERATPLTVLTVAVLRGWLAAHPGGPRDPLFATRTGTRLSRDALEHRLASYLATARINCPSLRGKHVTVHTLRHTCAMRLLESGTDVAVIALWLGHEKLSSVQTYLYADMAQKERAIARVIRRAHNPAAISPLTHCSPSSNSCSYADHTNRIPLPHKRSGSSIGITATSA